MRIAVVDDDETFLELIAWIFAERGWDTLGFDGRADTFAELAAAQPDLIVLDLHIKSGPCGWDILTLLEGDPRTFQIPVIVCSAAADEIRDRRDWLDQRGILTVEKPFDIDALLQMADAALGDPGSVRPRHHTA
jgi:DNA-binding response OmpR family regulator